MFLNSIMHYTCIRYLRTEWIAKAGMIWIKELGGRLNTKMLVLPV